MDRQLAKGNPNTLQFVPESFDPKIGPPLLLSVPATNLFPSAEDTAEYHLSLNALVCTHDCAESFET
jgi:hypothetical protein